MYVVDLVIFVKENDKKANKVRRVLQLYCDNTGQEINWAKSTVHFSHNVPKQEKGNLCRILGMQECNHKGKYLGQPFCHFKTKAVAFNGILENLSRKLSGWKQRNLSMAGRMVLIKSVVQALPSYTMETLLPRVLIGKMERKIKDFFWGFRDDKLYNLHLKAWTNVCKPKASGGIGFRKLADMNRAFVTKLAWTLNTQMGKPWVKLVRAKHL